MDDDKAVCEALAKRYLPDASITHVESFNESCLIDFKSKDLESEVQSQVDCDERCTAEGDYDSPEYQDCLEGCEDTVKTAITGSIIIDKTTQEIKESTIPISCSQFYAQTDFEPEWSPEKENKLLRALEKAGCTKMDIGWMHPHEFVPNPVEWEEEPAICYVHVESKEKGKCRLPDVIKKLVV